MNRSDFEGRMRRSRYTGHGMFVPKGDSSAPASYATAGAVTLTAADIYGGLIVRNPAGAARTDTTPTAAQLVAQFPQVAVGDIVSVMVSNASVGAADAEQITIAAGAGITFDANQAAAARIIRSQSQRQLMFRFTNVTPGSEAAVLYM